jgi:putative salt-induced outer membrane protein YdiY
MRRSPLRNELWWLRAIALWLVIAALAPSHGAQVVLHLKNGDRLTGKIVSETTNSVTLTTPFFGTVPVPLGEITKREILAEPAASTNNLAPAGTAVTNNAASGPTPTLQPAPGQKGPIAPANPEAAPMAATPNFWKNDIRFGLNTRYAAKNSQEILLVGKTTYTRPPWRHLFDASLKYGTIEGVVSANSVIGAEKTEYQLSPRTYLFNLLGAGYDEIRHIDAQADIGPGVGVELLNLTNFVWKSEVGFNFQQQYRSDDTEQTSYSLRLAEIFAWRIWDKLTADAKVEFFPNLAEFGEYRLRFESTLRYPVSNRLSLNLEFIDIYDTQPAKDVTPNDLQIRSTIGVNF